MKKLLVCALAAAMSVSLLAGCGNTAETAAPAATEAATEAAAEEAAPAEEAAAPTEVTDVALKVWCPQNQVDTKIM